MFDVENRRYVGNKYKLMYWINELIVDKCPNCKSFFDVFAGTGVVSKCLLNEFDSFILNDFLYSNEVIYHAFFDSSSVDMQKISTIADDYCAIDREKLPENYVSEQYGNKFFSLKDAKLIGYIREDIETQFKTNSITKSEYYVLLASLLYSSDRVANTCGHYDAYIKGKKIRDDFKFDTIAPLNTAGKGISIFRRDSNELVREIAADIAFIDPPYNSRQYSRFYHVLENLTKWEKPELFGVAMKPKEENMSQYCRSTAPLVFSDLIENINANYIVVTYNNTYNSKSSSSQNKITLEEIEEILRKKGSTEVFKKPYRFFNAGKTTLPDHKEYLFITKVN